ncbi:RING-H2 finger protein ATL33 [Linum perenne]
MEHPPTIFISPDPPPFPAPPRSVDLSPLEFVLALIAIITIPALIYTFFYSIKCPPSPFRSRRRDASSSDADTDSTAPLPPPTPPEKLPVADVKYKKESHASEIGIECPVCLSSFSDGEEVKQLSVCKHSFHTPCIDLWLNSHSNCPVCRASVAVKLPPPQTTAVAETVSSGSRGGRRRGGDQDLQQGLPDAGNLV